MKKKWFLSRGGAKAGSLLEGVCYSGNYHVEGHCLSVYFLTVVWLIFVCGEGYVVGLLIYIHNKHLWSWRDGQLT